MIRQPRKRSKAGAAAGAPPCLDTEAVTQRVTAKDHHNATTPEKDSGKTTIHKALAAGHRAWLGQVEATTAIIRDQKAKCLEERARRLSLRARRRHAGRSDGELEGSEAPKRERGVRGGVARSERGKPIATTEEGSRWHTSRAKGKRELFQRLNACGEKTRALRLTCKSCKEVLRIPIGCGQTMFCPLCRTKKARDFRADFSRKRAGLSSAAARAGLSGRYRRKGIRFGERMLTLTIPHKLGTETLEPVRRIRVLEAAFKRFSRLLGDDLRPELAKIGSGVSRLNAQTGEVDALHVKGKKTKGRFERPIETRLAKISDDELTLWDLVHHLWVREWTPGEWDALGNPHMHVWLHSPRVERPRMVELWRHALEETFEKPLDVDPIVHIRAAGPGIENELVKYLVKEWEVADDKVRRALPEVFAQVYGELDGRRQRQTSQGLSTFAVEKIIICRCCGYEPGYGKHWARIEFEFMGETESERLVARPVSTGPPLERAGPGIVDACPSLEAELRARYWAERDEDWKASLELRILRAMRRDGRQFPKADPTWRDRMRAR